MAAAAQRNALTAESLLLIAAVLRVVLVIYGHWQDLNLNVRYTDIDYVVFTDAARAVATGGSPYDRDTYRYTPLLAYLMLPNVYVHPAFGKLIFCLADIAAALLILFHIRTLSRTCSDADSPSLSQRLRSDTSTPQEQGGGESAAIETSRAPAEVAPLAFWLFNPYTATISTRGSSDSLVTAMQLLVLILLRPPASARIRQSAADAHPSTGVPSQQAGRHEREDLAAQQQQQRQQGKGLSSANAKLMLAGSVYGLLVHWRVFPVIYGPSLVAHLWHRSRQVSKPLVSFLCWAALFGIPAVTVFGALGAGFYHLYGDAFLHETFLYHLSRKDPRHNFAPHFFFTYLRWYSGLPADALPEVPRVLDPALGAPICMAAVTLVLAAVFRHELGLCWVLTTIGFVAFNKVSTAQYFVWYLGLVPIAWERLRGGWGRLQSAVVAAWVVLQLNWLLWAYMLEFKGRAVYVAVWLSGLLFQAAHASVIAALCLAYRSARQRKELSSRLDRKKR